MRSPLKTFLDENGWYILAVWAALVIIIGLIGVAVSLKNQAMIRNYKENHEEKQPK